MNKFIQKLRNQKLFLVLLIFFIGVSITNCKPEKKDLCNAYKDYFGDIKYPMGKQDSIDTYQYYHYLKRKVEENNGYFKGNPYSFSLFYYSKYLDTALYTSILIKNNSKFKEVYNKELGYNLYMALHLIISDAVFWGTVVGKDNYSDTCLHYKTTYYVKVDSIIHSYFPINPGDIVMIKSSLFGHLGDLK